MAKQFSRAFYKSRLWQDCRESYAKSKGWVCERCGRPGSFEVHHKILLTPENINDPSVTTNWEHLELLCWECHRQTHKNQDNKARQVRRYTIDEAGHVIIQE